MHGYSKLVEMVLGCCVAGIDCSNGWGHCTCSKHDPVSPGVAGSGLRGHFGNGAEVSVLIARGANSARHVGWVVVGAGSTSGKITGVGPLGRLHGLRWSRRRVLR